MTEPVQPEGNTPAAEPTPAAPSGETAPAFGTFGSTRGSGLARGKRNVQPSAAPAASSGEYKPTALEVIVPEREYKNPFGGPSETPSVEPTPAAPAAAEATAAPAEAPREPAPVVAEKPAPAPAPAPTPVFVPTRAPAAETATPAPKPELNILPQAEQRRPAVSWEHGPSSGPRQGGPDRESRGTREDRRDERATFRPEQPRREHDRGHDRGRGVPVQPKPRGFFAWLKGLFGSKPTQPAQPEGRREDRSFERSGEGDGHRRRRRRGGRGRNFGERRFEGGERQDRPQDGPGGERRFEGGERREGEGGNRRHRHRGGRGRGRGDFRGPRPEGQQGGGAI
jgi:hypothetical protein